jgi:hypothetical protein
MEPGFAVIATAVVVDGLIAGMSLDAALVKLPARKRIGSVAYARFARGNDLTTRAAPIMLSLRTAPDEERVLEAKLDRFAFWNAFRAAFQGVAFLALVWALVVARP